MSIIPEQICDQVQEFLNKRKRIADHLYPADLTPSEREKLKREGIRPEEHDE